MRFLPFRACAGLVTALSLVAQGQAATDSAYAVQASAIAQSSPAQITLSWTPGPGAATGYALSRKDPNAAAWTPLINLTGGITHYTDTTVSPGRVYEYQIVRQSANFTGYGYVAAGIDVPAPDSRGRLILVVDSSIAGALGGDIDRLVSDLTGDGWTVARHDVGRGDAPPTVRDVIRNAYSEDRANTRAVLLVGHVPVAKSGPLNIDGHGDRLLPTDAYYGDMDGAWADLNGDGGFDQQVIPSDIELAVGRIDFADMPSFGNEVDLLRRYLSKDHDFRHAIRRVSYRALVGDRFGDFDGEAFGASGFRNFAALVGPDRVVAANVEDNAPAGERWISRLTAGDWLWVYGGGGGGDTTISGLGLRGEFNDVASTDLVNGSARGTFYLLFGSWLEDWSQPDNIMRAALAAPDYGLTAAWSGRPHLVFHRMAMGETTGDAIRLSQNNATLYSNQVNQATRGVHIALLGDPTLHMQVVAPPTDLRVGGSGGPPALSWTASPEADAGYQVYRANSDAGPFTRVNSAAVTGTSFTDTSAPAGNFTYLVRALHRETSGGGTYFNLSQGIFAQATVTNANPTPSPPTGNPSPPSGGSTGSGSGGGGAVSPAMLTALAVLALIARRRRARRDLKLET
jgi:hypothetical protein